MSDEDPAKPTPPELPTYVLDPLEKQSPERLDTIASYADELAAWKRAQRTEEEEAKRAQEAIEPEEREALESRDVSTDPEDYEEVPESGAYITVKETKPGYKYYYWQWREGDSWKNRYIGPVDMKSD